MTECCSVVCVMLNQETLKMGDLLERVTNVVMYVELTSFSIL